MVVSGLTFALDSTRPVAANVKMLNSFVATWRPETKKTNVINASLQHTRRPSFWDGKPNLTYGLEPAIHYNHKRLVDGSRTIVVLPFW